MESTSLKLEPQISFSANAWKNYKPEIEDSFLAAIIENSEYLNDYEFITPSHFYQPQAKMVWTKIKQHQEKGIIVDLLMLSEYFRTLGEYNSENQIIDYLFNVAGKLSFSCHLDLYADELHQLFIRRSLVNLGIALQQQAENPNSIIPDVLNTLFEKMQALSDDQTESISRHIGQVGISTLANTTARQEGSLPPSIPSGFISLDNTTGGFEGGQLVTIGARPSIGKSTFALNLAINIATNGNPILFISLETTPERMTEKIISRNTGVLQTKLTTGNNIQSDDWDKLYQSVEDLENVPFYFDDQVINSARDVESRIDKLERKNGVKLKVVFIDYLQLMLREDSSNNNNNAIGKITMALKLLAMKRGITIVILSQLSRGVEGRSDKRPIMSDLRDSGSIEQDSNMIMLLYRDDYYNLGTATPNTMEVNLCKNRDGATGLTTLHFNRTISKLSTIHN
jgi:replicative DNA helicase